MRLPRMTRIAAVTAALVVAATLAAPAPSAQAGPDDRKRAVDASIDSLKHDLADTGSDLAAAYLALKKTESRLPAARAKLAGAERDLAAARARDAELGRKLAVSKANEAKALDDLAATAKESSATSATLGGIARQAYQTGGMGELAVALQAQSADDFATRVVLVDTAMRIQGDALARLGVIAAETTAKRARLTAVRRQTALLKAQAAANLVRAKALKDAAAAAKAQVDALVADQKKQVAVVEARKAAERRRMDALQAESNKLEAQLAEIARQARLRAARQHRTSRASSNGLSGGYLSQPVHGYRISSEFGMRYHPILHYWRLHAGIDFAVPCGTPVHAAAAGRVVSAGWGGGYGNRIVVDHGIVRGVGLATTYNHLSRIVKHGGSVSRGQLIGYSGTTGESTGCHLHFETRENGVPKNPRRWL